MRRPAQLPDGRYRRGNEFHVEPDLPGVEPDSIDLTVEQVLRIRAERVYEPEADDEILVDERPQGVFARQLFLAATARTCVPST